MDDLQTLPTPRSVHDWSQRLMDEASARLVEYEAGVQRAFIEHFGMPMEDVTDVEIERLRDLVSFMHRIAAEYADRSL